MPWCRHLCPFVKTVGEIETERGDDCHDKEKIGLHADSYLRFRQL